MWADETLLERAVWNASKLTYQLLLAYEAS